MKKVFIYSLLLLTSLTLTAQKFRPYHAFGFQVNANYSSLSSEQKGDPSHYPAPLLYDGNLRFDIFASYDYGIIKWFGLSSGIGFIWRGGANENMITHEKKRRDLYYLAIPLKLQFKPLHFLWLEPGIEAKYFLAHRDVGYDDPNTPFDPSEINTFDLAALLGLRFNLFKRIIFKPWLSYRSYRSGRNKSCPSHN